MITKKEIQTLINEGKDIIYLQDYIGFEDIGQGYGYKSYDAWDSDESDDSDVIVYIPEYCYETGKNENGIEITTLDICSCYTKEDFINLTGDLEKAKDLFESVDWQHPYSLWSEWDIDEE